MTVRVDGYAGNQLNSLPLMGIRNLDDLAEEVKIGHD